MNLKELRQKNGFTQKEIAEKIKTNRANYNRYELEKGEPDIKTLINLANVYHVSLDELVGRKQDNVIDKGLMSEIELNIIDLMKELNPENLNRLESYGIALYQTQHDEKDIIDKVKN